MVLTQRCDFRVIMCTHENLPAGISHKPPSEHNTTHRHTTAAGLLLSMYRSLLGVRSAVAPSRLSTKLSTPAEARLAHVSRPAAAFNGLRSIAPAASASFASPLFPSATTTSSVSFSSRDTPLGFVSTFGDARRAYSTDPSSTDVPVSVSTAGTPSEVAPASDLVSSAIDEVVADVTADPGVLDQILDVFSDVRAT
jgi:hypothetical protein